MARPALSATRALDIISFLAEHPHEGLTMAQLTRALHLNQGSAHAVLTAMTEQGFLTRHPEHRTFRLGPALVNVGDAATLANPIVVIAREELQSLSDRLQLPALASMRTGMELRVVVRVGPHVAVGPNRRVGQRYPLVPPLGAALVAWSADDVQQAWIAARPDGMDEDALVELLGEIRRRGFDLGVGAKARRELGRAAEQLADQPHDERAKATVRARAGSVPPTVSAGDGVAVVSAAVLDTAGSAILECSVYGFASPLAEGEVSRIAKALADACTVIARRAAATDTSIPIERSRSQEVG